ncbi:dihydrofolate reductase family protein [Saccharopolyspora sp. NPDC050642]|uniref:dihydrofolate reductase family protein n=1 Tax=Saccharopolyspora sp. NPDC050642 TaxID=3157099 RepID=UPI0033C37236
MRKLIESTFVTLDGTISAPEQWGPPYWDSEHYAHAHKLLFGTDALLLGRETYESFAHWPAIDDEYGERINGMPKYVASRTLQNSETTWNATILGSDVAAEVAELKQQPGQDILKFGTGVLDHTLLEHGLVDELDLWLFPVIAGGGQRILEGLATTHLTLAETTTLSSGIVVAVYEPKSDAM